MIDKKINQFQFRSRMQSYLQSLVASSSVQTPTVQRIRESLKNIEQDNITLQKELQQYQQKISQLPLEIRHKIQHQQYLPSQQCEIFSNARQTLESQHQSQLSSPHSPNIFTSIVDKNLLEEKLRNLEEEEQQIEYISRLSDMYIRCQKNQQTGIMIERSTQQMEELQEIAQFIESIKLYAEQSSLIGEKEFQQFQLVNNLIQNMKLHTSKKLTQKCQNLIHYGPSGNNQKIVIQKFLIKNCKSIILGQNSVNNTKTNKELKIITKFVEKILGDVIYYDVSYQKIILMQVIANQQNSQQNIHQQVISRKKIYFFPSETQKHFDSIQFTLQYHIDKVNELKSILLLNQPHQLQQMFEKIVQRHISLIKSNLEYILPYINIKSRKAIMAILAEGKDEVIEFEDLVLRLKFKGQDGDMFMNNLDAVFSRLLQVNQGQEEDSQKQNIRFNQNNFQTLTNFFQLGIFQAQQSLLQSSSKAIKKLTTSFTSRNNFQKPSTKHTSKKLFNMIFFSVSNLIQRFDELLDKEGEKFAEYSRSLGKSYEEKVCEWMDKLIQIRESVRKRIHQE